MGYGVRVHGNGVRYSGIPMTDFLVLMWIGMRYPGAGNLVFSLFTSGLLGLSSYGGAWVEADGSEK